MEALPKHPVADQLKATPASSLEYERLDLKRDPHAIARLLARRPSRAVIIGGWVGAGLLLWGSALFVGGIIAIAVGATFSSLALVRITWWEFLGRPYLRRRNVHAAPVARGGWLVLLILIAMAVHAMGLGPPLAARLTRPLWVPMADHWYASRPATAPEPRVLVVGPYVLINADIHPHGIDGQVIGGERISMSWNDSTGWQVRPSDRHHVPLVYRLLELLN